MWKQIKDDRPLLNTRVLFFLAHEENGHYSVGKLIERNDMLKVMLFDQDALVLDAYDPNIFWTDLPDKPIYE